MAILRPGSSVLGISATFSFIQQLILHGLADWRLFERHLSPLTPSHSGDPSAVKDE